jgi:cation-transporting P-type ATPase E
MLNRKTKNYSAEELAPIEADFMVGLTPDEVNKRESQGLVNRLPKKVTKSYPQIFADNLFSFFNLIFLSITILMLVAGMKGTYYFFLIPIVGNIIVGLVADLHARRLVDKLRLFNEEKIHVMRDKKEVELPLQELVLSDILVLYAGDQLPADAVIVNGRLAMDESLVSGESTYLAKRPGDSLLSGSIVHSGKAYARVEHVGNANYAEKLEQSAKTFMRPRSELKASVLKIFAWTGSTAALLFLAMLATWLITDSKQGVALDYAAFQGFIKGTSGSIVAMIPAGLYLLISLTLAIGIINLAKRRIDVQELYSIEMLSRVDTICFDKTGTLTDGKLQVSDFYNYSEASDLELKDYLASLLTATGDANPTALCLKNTFGVGSHRASWALAFSSETKYSAASFKDEGTYVLAAPGFVEAAHNEIGEARIQHLCERGHRVLAIYYGKKEIENGALPRKLALIGVISLQDHIKDDAKETIAWFKKSGVAVKLISGDSPITSSEIANAVGIEGAANEVSLEKVSDEELPSLVKANTVFGRVTPEQKAAIIGILQSEGHKVAMVGDGVNDILALKKADCSIAMASGAMASRNVAHLVSLDNDFSKLPAVVIEGRRVINNLQRSSTLFLSKTLFAILTTLVFLIVSWIQNTPYAYPFTTKSLIVWETITIGFGGLFLSLQPSKEPLKGSYLKNVIQDSLPSGLFEFLSMIVIFSAYWISPSFFGEDSNAYGAAAAIAVFAFTAISYLVLAKVSYPFDRYRTIVFCLSFLLGVGYFLLDIFWGQGNLLGIPYSTLPSRAIILDVVLVVVIAILYATYVVLSRLMRAKKAGGKVS